jgi:flavin-dependent dehydrogenase
MLAAAAAFEAMEAGRQHDELVAYPAAFRKSWLHAELMRSKNFKHGSASGRSAGIVMTGIEQWLLPKLGMKVAPRVLRLRILAVKNSTYRRAAFLSKVKSVGRGQLGPAIDRHQLFDAAAHHDG